MWPFRTRERPPTGRWWTELSALSDRIDAVAATESQHFTEFKRLRGLVHEMRAKDDPGDTIPASPEAQPHHTERSVPAPLRRRIRGF